MWGLALPGVPLSSVCSVALYLFCQSLFPAHRVVDCRWYRIPLGNIRQGALGRGEKKA